MTPSDPRAQANRDDAPTQMSLAFWNWQDVALAVCLAVPCLVAAALLARPLPFLKSLKELLAQFAFYGAWLALLRLMFRFKYGRTLRDSLRFRLSKGVWIALPAGIALAVVTSAIGFLLRAPLIDPPFKDLWDRVDTFVLFVFAGVVLGPIVEELFFRGLLMPWIARLTGAAASIFAVAIPFALLHGSQYRWSWQYLILVGMSGVAFGWARLKFDSTLASALMHAAYNFTFLLGSTLGKLS